MTTSSVFKSWVECGVVVLHPWRLVANSCFSVGFITTFRSQVLERTMSWLRGGRTWPGLAPLWQYFFWSHYWLKNMHVIPSGVSRCESQNVSGKYGGWVQRTLSGCYLQHHGASKGWRRNQRDQREGWWEAASMWHGWSPEEAGPIYNTYQLLEPKHLLYF